MWHFNKPKKIVLSVVLVLFLFVEFFGLLLAPLPAQAIGGAVTVPALEKMFTGKWSWERLGKSLTAAALGSLVHAASYFMRRMAYDAATWVASGGKGQGALAFKKGPAAYFGDLAKDSAADAIGELGKPFGLNLCQTPDIRVQVFLQVGLRNLYDGAGGPGGGGGPQPKCDWQTFRNSWSAEAFEQKYGPGGRNLLPQKFADVIRVEQSDFGLALGAIARVDRMQAEAVAGAQTERIEGQGFKPVTDLISGKTLAPAQTVQEEAKGVTAKSQTELSYSQIAGIYGVEALQVFPMAASVFLNTLTSQLLKNLLTKCWFCDSADSGGVTDFYADYVARSRQQAQQAFSFLVTAVSRRQLSSYNIVAEFADCPRDRSSNPGLNNCVIDSDLQAVIDLANSGSPLTIAKALEQGMLHGDWPLISPKRVTDNTNIRDCYLKGYCYSNLQKLRKARILPLGFEIAALLSDPDKPWLLKEVVNGFENCQRDGEGQAVYNPNFPFCHLINPNWIIRAPEARCQASVYGPVLSSFDSAQRREECVDLSTHIDEFNSSQNYFSYCLQESNVWEIGGRSCPSYYNTCQSYFDKQGKVLNYLSRTLDYGQCNSEAVGCRAYSSWQDPSTEGEPNWVNSENNQAKQDLRLAGLAPNYYFNQTIANFDCLDGEPEGCSLFHQALKDEEGDFIKPPLDSASPLYLKKAPAYLGCYDIYPATTTTIDWPSTKPELLLLADKPEQCADFAQACLPSEVGCESYTLVNDPGAPAVPGIVGDNSCPAACVGYDTFKQAATNFAPAEFPLYFIPSAGQSCPAKYAGCDEFTNIDIAARGGEGLEYYSGLRYCERPDQTNEKTYYSWQGSVKEGYILKVHRLRPVKEDDLDYYSALNLADEAGVVLPVAEYLPVGSPAYADDSAATLQINYAICNEKNYNILINNPYPYYSPLAAHDDCRALYDNQGQVSYRLLKEIITVSEACHPLRKTESRLFTDESLSGEDKKDACEFKGGLWDGFNNTCQRCYSGGRYDKSIGFCVYWTISAPGESYSCPSSANLCREYIGNTGNNIKTVLYKNFEPADDSADALNEAKAGWQGNVSVKPESLQVGQYSLEINDDASYEFSDDDLEPSDWYELSFWARGETQAVNVFFRQDGENMGQFTFDPLSQSEAPTGISADWQEYRLGPTQFKGLGGQEQETELVFDRASDSDPYYLDNIRLTRLQDSSYLIKNSWKQTVNYLGQAILADVSLACDSTPTDPYPGAALGCRAYKDSKNQTVYATQFEQLCRPEAVGCTALFDTFNTPDIETTSSFKLWCEGNQQGKCELTAELEMGKDTEKLAGCAVEPGQDGCYVARLDLPAGLDSFNQVNNAKITTSTIIMPADSAQAIFLTNRQEFVCTSNNLGCTKVALEEKTYAGVEGKPNQYDFVETYYKLNPTHFNDTLCQSDLVGCAEFRSGKEVVYFKDPRLWGNGLCEYRLPAKGAPTSLGGWYSATSTSTESCYPSYLQAGGTYGLWSNDSERYEGLVGLCPAQENGCTELVDRADPDTSQLNEPGKPYYVIFDNNLLAAAGECQGRVSLKEGCVLFDKTDRPNKLFDTKATYAKSAQPNLSAGQRYELVDPVKPGDAGFVKADANLILKVERDRECSQWLACKDAVVVKDKDGSAREVCYVYWPCEQLDEAGRCLSFADDPEGKLTAAKYVERDTDWYAPEYSGYSLHNQYQISRNYYQLTLSDSDSEEKNYLAYEDLTISGCEDNLSCGEDGKGFCYQGHCLLPLAGEFPAEMSVNKLGPALLTEACKAYPEVDSPFSFALAGGDQPSKLPPAHQNPNPSYYRLEFTSPVSGYADANICQNGDCSCSYEKITYKNNAAVDYWTPGAPAMPASICQGGDKDGYPCDNNKQACVDNGGQCVVIQSKGLYQGQTGYCLEYDFSRPLGQIGKETQYACLTWLPVDDTTLGFDNFQSFASAGYDPGLDSSTGFGQVYCTEATGSGQMTYDKDMYKDTYPIGEYLFNGKLVYPEVSYNWLDLRGYDNVKKKYEKWVEKVDFSYTLSASIPGTPTISVPITINYSDNLPPAVREQVNLVIRNIEHETGPNNYSDTVIKIPGQGRLPSTNVWKDGEFNITLDTPYMSRFGWVEDFTDSITAENYQKLLYSKVHRWLTIFQQRTNGLVWWVINPAVWQTMANVPYLAGDSIIYPLNNELEISGPPVAEYKVSRDLYENEIAKIWFTPALLYNDEGDDGPDSDDRWLITPDVHIDIAALRDGSESKTFSISGKEISYNFRSITNPNEPNDTKYNFHIYTFRGVVEAGDERGKIRYGIIIVPASDEDYEDGGGQEAAKTEIQWLFDGQTTVTQFERIGLTFDFDPDTGKLLTKFPLKWGRFTGLSQLYKGAYEQFLLYGHGPALAVAVELKSRCVDFSTVHDSAAKPSQPRNKAWTDRVWQSAKNKANFLKVFFQSFFDKTDESIRRKAPHQPFGSLPLNPTDLVDKEKTKRYVFENIDNSGIPFSCANNKLINTQQFMFGAEVPMTKNEWWKSWCAGLAYDSYSEWWSVRVNTYEIKTGSELLEQLFAQTFKSLALPAGNDKDFTFTSGVDASTKFTGLNVPQIASLNPATCQGIFGSDNDCTKGEDDNFSINGLNGVMTDYNNDEWPDEDLNKDGETDYPLGLGVYLARANFFAWADDNRMPIKRVMVDWNDGLKTNNQKYGLYKNQKQECEGEDFGSSDRACNEGYFQFIHTYTCSLADEGEKYWLTWDKLEAGQKNQIKAMGYGQISVCVFKPKVQVLDNWGYCNGSCLGGDAGNLCYNDGPAKECDKDVDAWTSYEGNVIVIPK